MDRHGAVRLNLDYHDIVDRFINEKLRPRIRSNAYTEKEMALLRRLEWELLEIMADQRCDNRKTGSKEWHKGQLETD
jgi:hypothetical protein